MKKVSFLVLAALLIAFLSPLTCFAGQSQDHDPASMPDVAQGDESGQSDQSDQAGEADQIGQSKGCGLWKFIKTHLEEAVAKKSEKNAELLKKLLVLVSKDLELALGAIDGKKTSYRNVIPAVGHLNHALSALGKCHPPRHLKPAFKQLAKRISHAKFYLVTFDLDEATARIEAAREYIGDLEE